jgi:ABC-2 type transport system permease protein
MIKRILAVIVKEYISIWEDKRTRITLFVPPIIQFFVFTFAATLDVNNVSLGILNHDNGEVSFELIQRLKGSSIFKKIINLESNEEIAKVIDMQKVLLVLQFDNEFSKKVNSGEIANIQAILDGRKSNTAQIVQGYISQIAERYNQELAVRYHRTPLKSSIVPRNWYNVNLTYSWFTISGLVGTLSMIASLSFTSLSIAREKEMGTFEQLLVSPITPIEIILGKIIPPFIIGVTEASFMLCLGVFILGLPVEGNLFYLFLAMFIFILSIEGIGIFISSITKTQQQATLGIFLFITPAVALSGFATPVDSMPKFMQWITILDPLKYFLIVIRGVCFKAMPPGEIWKNIGPMVLIALSTLSISMLFFRKQIR